MVEGFVTHLAKHLSRTVCCEKFFFVEGWSRVAAEAKEFEVGERGIDVFRFFFFLFLSLSFSLCLFLLGA